jgi:hypothetical protein
MRAAIFVETDLVANGPSSVLNAFKAMSVYALFLQCSDDAFHHAVLLQAVRCDELLFQTIATNQSCEVPTSKNQPVVGSEKNLVLDCAKGPKSADQRVLQSGTRGCCPTCSSKMPTK